jgi:hypothetical protein
MLHVRLNDANPFAVYHHSDTRNKLRPEVIAKQIDVCEGNKARVLCMRCTKVEARLLLPQQ